MMPSGLRRTAPGSRHGGSSDRSGHRRRAHIAAALAALLLLAAGCSKGSQAQQPKPRPSTPAQIAIVAPAGGATVAAPTLHVVLTLSGAALVPPDTSTGDKPTEGHIHLSLDGSIVSMTSGLTQDVAVTPGPHLLQAEFVANDHLPFSPRDIVSVHFTAQ
jgi:hypothetical protein